MKLLIFFIELPFRLVFALVMFTLTGWIGWMGIILVSLRLFGVIHWPWWLALLPLEYGLIYCLYMTIDGALYRAGLKKIGGYARLTQPGLTHLTQFEREAQEVIKLSQIGKDADIAEKQAEIAPKIAAMVAEARAQEQSKEKRNE